MHKSSLDEMQAFKERYLKGRENEALLILDLGSLDINGSYKAFFDFPAWTYKGIDMAEGKNVDIILQDPYRWQNVSSNSADVVISGQAFEHIEFFWLTILEIFRVLKPGGLCCLIAPSGGPEHRFPVDCWRFFTDGFSAIARFASMEILEVRRKDTSTYTDGSEMWQDVVLVCRKPAASRLFSWKAQIRNYLLTKLLK
ncbi:MAG: hypothetical protein BWK80_18110 [Desulfobacteraceae bacterium IS3]|nr:MAG: hypothetical protein BWK80_18110 [Desulfobacteraceae bacterium IS3]